MRYATRARPPASKPDLGTNKTGSAFFLAKVKSRAVFPKKWFSGAARANRARGGTRYLLAVDYARRTYAAKRIPRHERVGSRGGASGARGVNRSCGSGLKKVEKAPVGRSLPPFRLGLTDSPCSSREPPGMLPRGEGGSVRAMRCREGVGGQGASSANVPQELQSQRGACGRCLIFHTTFISPQARAQAQAHAHAQRG